MKEFDKIAKSLTLLTRKKTSR